MNVKIGDKVLARNTSGEKLVIATVVGFTPKKVKVTGTQFNTKHETLITKFTKLDNIDLVEFQKHLDMFNNLI